MSSKEQMGASKKRKKHHSDSAASVETQRSDRKKTKRVQSKASMVDHENDQRKNAESSRDKPLDMFDRKKLGSKPEETEPMAKEEPRLTDMGKAEARKKIKKPHHNLEKKLALLWEKFKIKKGRHVDKEERSRFVTEALQKMYGKIPEIATFDVSSHILQSCLKYCSQGEKDAVFEELQPHLLTLSINAYAVHLVKKMLDNANQKQLNWYIACLRGSVSSLLQNMVGSIVVEHAFQLGNEYQKCQLLSELYYTEVQLSKDMTLSNESRLVDIISKMGLEKSSVLQHMTSVIQPILEKKIVDHSIIHTFLMEYFSIANRTSAMYVIEQLSGPALFQMIHTKEGSMVGMLCIKHGSTKERKRIVEAMKGCVGKIALDHYSCLVLISILLHIEDTKLLTEIVILDMQATLKNLLLDKNGRLPLLLLLHPQCQSYLGRDELSSLNLSIPSFLSQNNATELTNPASLEKTISSDVHRNVSGKPITVLPRVDAATNTVSRKNSHLIETGKKDPAERRHELLMHSGLGESLIDMCTENVEELLFSHYGKDCIYEVSMGGAEEVLSASLPKKWEKLHETIASLAAIPKVDESKVEHVFVNFHANRTIRKLILNCTAFAITLWNVALKGRCEMWAQGHSLKILSAYLESSDSEVKNLAKMELQPLVDNGIVKVL